MKLYNRVEDYQPVSEFLGGKQFNIYLQSK